jgi:DNA-binding LacI/PurR family transcriptional regulator
VHAYAEGTVLDNVHQHINLALQRAVARRGWSALAVHVGERSPAEVLEQLRAARAWGIVLETVDRGLLDMVREAGIPAIMVNAWSEGAAFDVVLQDNYQGGFLAAQHLLNRGHRRIAWFGPVGESCFSRERLGGAAAALAAAGLDLPAELRTDTAGRDLEPAALELLSRRDRPRAVLALWTDVALALAAAARKLGLVLGRDLDMVGWALEAHLEKYRPTFAGGPVPPMITWRVEDLARAAVARLTERRADLGLPAMRIAVATRLAKGDET